MSTSREPLATSLSVPLWGLVVTAAAMLALFPLTADHDFLVTGMVGAALVVFVGVLARAEGAVRPFAVPLQLLVLVLWATALIAPDQAWLGVLPTPSALEALRYDIDRVLTLAATNPAPLPPSPALAGLLALIVAVLAALVDLLAVTARRAPLVGLLLLGVYMAPVASLSGQVSIHAFWPGALAWVGLLLAAERTTMQRWSATTEASADSAGRPSAGWNLDLLGRQVGLSAVGVALIVPFILPAASLQLVGSGGLLGDGAGGGSGVISVNNPVLDLRRNLVTQPDIRLLTVQTDDPAPGYLRTSVLDAFTGTRWEPSSRDESNAVDTDDDLPSVPGRTVNMPTREVSYAVRVSPHFNSSWLPVLYAPTSVDVEGDWRVDRDTMDVVVGDDEEALTSMSYEFTSTLVDPSPAQLRAAPPPPEALGALTDLPDDVPAIINQRAREVTAGTTTDYDAALAIEQWFRDPDEFVYSTEPASGTGMQTIAEFIGEGREGYCEQFASAMALMARSVDIPARVAVGFLRPEIRPGRGGQTSYVFAGGDLHAWPELYFEGVGWVRFEPTPADRTGNAGSTNAEDAPADSGGRVPEPERVPQGDTAATETLQAVSEAPMSVRSDVSLRTVAGTLVLLGLAGLPAAWRAARARRRWATVSSNPQQWPEAAWAELGDSVLDLRRPWDRAATPRSAGAALTPLLRDDPSAEKALARLVRAVERSRFADASSNAGADAEAVAPSAQAEVDLIVRAVADGCNGKQRRLARWWPRSVWAVSRPGWTNWTKARLRQV